MADGDAPGVGVFVSVVKIWRRGNGKTERSTRIDSLRLVVPGSSSGLGLGKDRALGRGVHRSTQSTAAAQCPRRRDRSASSSLAQSNSTPQPGVSGATANPFSITSGRLV